MITSSHNVININKYNWRVVRLLKWVLPTVTSGCCCLLRLVLTWFLLGVPDGLSEFFCTFLVVELIGIFSAFVGEEVSFMVDFYMDSFQKVIEASNHRSRLSLLTSL